MLGVATEDRPGDAEKPVRGVRELETNSAFSGAGRDEFGVFLGDGFGHRCGRVHKLDIGPDHALQRRSQQRVVGAAENHGLGRPNQEAAPE